MEKPSTPSPRIFSWSGNMKRAIVIEVLLFFVLGVLIAIDVWCFYVASVDFYFLKFHDDLETLKWAYTYLTYAIFLLLAVLADIVVIVLVALKEFPVFKPLIDKYKARKEERKQQRAEAAAIQAEVDKQERIKKLQTELDELKKDE